MLKFLVLIDTSKSSNSRTTNVNLKLKLSDDYYRGMGWLGALPLGSRINITS